MSIFRRKRLPAPPSLAEKRLDRAERNIRMHQIRLRVLEARVGIIRRNGEAAT